MLLQMFVWVLCVVAVGLKPARYRRIHVVYGEGLVQFWQREKKEEKGAE